MSEKLALTPYDIAVLTAAGQGLMSGVSRANHPETPGEPTLERGIGKGLTTALGHLATAVPVAYGLKGLGAGNIFSTLGGTLAGVAGGAAAPAIARKATQVAGEASGGPIRLAAEKKTAMLGTSPFTYDATSGPPPEVTLGATAPGTVQAMDPMGMNMMGSMGFPPPRPKKPKEAPAMKTETKPEAPKSEEKPAKEAAADASTFMSSFMGKWRATSGKPMAEKVALYRKSGFGSAMKRSAAC